MFEVSIKAIIVLVAIVALCVLGVMLLIKGRSNDHLRFSQFTKYAEQYKSEKQIEDQVYCKLLNNICFSFCLWNFREQIKPSMKLIDLNYYCCLIKGDYEEYGHLLATLEKSMKFKMNNGDNVLEYTVSDLYKRISI